MQHPATYPSYVVLIVVMGALLLILAVGGGLYAVGAEREARAELALAQKAIADMQERVVATEEENEKLRTLVQQKAEESETFGKQVTELTNYLDKLSKTDRELLQKYSSVYFLSDNFVPNPLVPIDDNLLARRESNATIHGNVFPFLADMMNMARIDGDPLLVLSAYRSFGTQGTLKADYQVTYGSGANKFSADQGYSEHQLGSTVDFTTPEDPESLTTEFAKTPQYRWLTLNAHKYGFILSYPKDNAYFQFEPWHWRFVGIALATRMYNENKYFYDLDQRDINPYLARIFDN